MLTSGHSPLRQGFTDRLSLLLESLKQGRNRRRARQRDIRAALTTEVLEQRALLTNLVGVDLGGGSVPTNWTGTTATSDVTLTDLMGEDGPTGIDLFIDFDSTLQGGNELFSPLANQLPIHTNSLAGIDRSFADQGNVVFHFTGLTPDQDYAIYVFAGDTVASNQRVMITGGAPTFEFTQPHTANQLVVNSMVGSDATPLEDYAVVMTSDGSGHIDVAVDSSPAVGGFFGVAGIAIEEVVPPPPPIFLDNGDAGFSTIGAWTFTNNANGRGGNLENAFMGRGQDVARWEFNGLTPGNYAVSATWVAHQNRATNSPFTAFDLVGGNVLNSTVVNQELAPNDFTDDGADWEDLFIVEVTGSTLVIELNNAANQYVIADAVRIQPTMAPLSPVAFIVDDGDAGFNTTGAWSPSADGSGRQNDLRHHTAGTGAETATWTFSNLTPGNYLVSATWVEAVNRATNAPFRIFDGLGGPELEFVKLNQEQAPDDFNDRGSNWENLAVVGILGTELVVQLSDDANQFVLADAIRIEPTMLPPLPPGVVIDNGDSKFETTGAWNSPVQPNGHEGDLQNSTAGDGSSVARWVFQGLLPGEYTVSATWLAHGNRASNAPFTILDGTGPLAFGTGDPLAVVGVNQKTAPDDFATSGSHWEVLATVTISSTELVVELSDDANGYVIADAIRVQPANPPTAHQALADYVYDPTNPSSYAFDSTFTGSANGVDYTAYVLDVESQTWRDASEVDKPVWNHWVTIYVPDGVTSNTAVLFIDGGNNAQSAPTSGDSEAATFATLTGQVVVHVRTVPSEPLIFTDEGFPRSEDEIIAYSFDKYLETGDEEFPLLIAMVNSAVAAMDSAQDYDSNIPGIDIQDFVVTGASKRGWTTWLTAAVDPRVKAIVPLVFDVLNMKPSLLAHKEQYEGYNVAIVGGYSDSVHDYTDIGIFDRFNTFGADQLRQIVDPYEYRDVLTMPKYLVHSAGDEFFTPESSQFYFHDLQGPTYQRYVPNTGHGLNFDALEKEANFIKALDQGLTLPEFDWTISPDGQTISVQTGGGPADTPTGVKLWQSRQLVPDWRNSVITSNYGESPLTDQGGGVFVANVPPPSGNDDGGTAFFIELTYNIGGMDLIFTTDISIVDSEPAG